MTKKSFAQESSDITKRSARIGGVVQVPFPYWHVYCNPSGLEARCKANAKPGETEVTPWLS